MSEQKYPLREAKLYWMLGGDIFWYHFQMSFLKMLLGSQLLLVVVLNLTQWLLGTQEAIDAPRFRHWEGSSVSFEQGIPQSTVDELYSLGHAPQNPVMATVQGFFHGNNPGLVFGGGQGVMKTSTGYVAGSDSRRDGVAAAH